MTNDLEKRYPIPSGQVSVDDYHWYDVTFEDGTKVRFLAADHVHALERLRSQYEHKAVQLVVRGARWADQCYAREM